MNPTFISPIPEEKSRAGVFDPGEILRSRFESLELLGATRRAGFYLGRDGDELVVAKVFTGGSEEQLELFQQETSSAARLSHPNIIKANAPEETYGVHFSILEHHADAETLKELLDRGGWLDAISAIRLARQLADALDYAHSLGVLHLAIHPETILIDDGEALLTDFGVESREELGWAQVERSGECPVEYLSPEQASGRLPDSRSDLYSLGVVLYQMLTDRLPIDSESPDSVRQRLGTPSALSPHLFSEDIPLQVSEVVTRLLERDPDMRFADAASLRTALDACIGQFINDGPESEGSVQEVVNSSPEEDNSRLEGNTIAAVKSRQRWETPAITVVNQPAEAMVALDLPSDSVLVGEDQWPPDEVESEADPIDVVSVSNAGLNPAPDREGQHGRMVALPLILGVMLALLAITGIIVLARADRAKAENPSAVESPAIDGADEAGADRPEGPSSEAARPVPWPRTPSAQQQSGSNGSATTPAAGLANPTTSAVRSRRFAAVRPRVSPRLRRTKRRWVRPAAYWRNHPYRRAR
jgi:serine/threonine protein kinase